MCDSHFKGICILCNEYNVAFGIIAVPLLKLFLSIMLIFALFAFARLYREISFISLVLSSLRAFNCTLTLVAVITAMACLYDISSKFSKNIYPQIRLITEKKARRIAAANFKSCRAIGCKVGSLYQMEAEVTLLTFHELINGVVFLLVNVKK